MPPIQRGLYSPALNCTEPAQKGSCSVPHWEAEASLGSSMPLCISGFPWAPNISASLFPTAGLAAKTDFQVRSFNPPAAQGPKKLSLRGSLAPTWGDMYLSKWALVSESQPGTLLSSQGELGGLATTTPRKRPQTESLVTYILKGKKRKYSSAFGGCLGLISFVSATPTTTTTPPPSPLLFVSKAGRNNSV